MGNVTHTNIKKYINALNKMKAKYVTCEKLSKEVGIYPEIIADHLSMFNPLTKLDTSFNLRELVPAMKEYLIKEEAKKTPVVHTGVSVSKKEVETYASVYDFFYKKMTIGGMIDRSSKLDKKDLTVLRRLVNEELKNNKK